VALLGAALAVLAATPAWPASGREAIVQPGTSRLPRLPRQDGQRTPNILFVIMDDVGIDQMRVFGYDVAKMFLPPSS